MRAHFTTEQCKRFGIEEAEHFPYYKHKGTEHYVTEFEIEAYIQRLGREADEKIKILSDKEAAKLVRAEEERVEKERLEREEAEGKNHG
jgi:hypothetical protein